MKRPWSGQVETIADDIIPDHDPNNPLCPRVTRPNGQVLTVFLKSNTNCNCSVYLSKCFENISTHTQSLCDLFRSRHVNNSTLH